MSPYRPHSFLFIFFLAFTSVQTLSDQERLRLKNGTRDMFYHAFSNYMTYAFPHDELKPLTASFTDSFVELGNLNLAFMDKNTYHGIALTLIDSLSTLAVLGDKQEFQKGVKWLIANVSFDINARVNVFEADIRVLGGLLSAHLIASDSGLNMMDSYNGELLNKAYDIGRRLAKAFSTPTGIPYAWVNLRSGVMEGETTEQCTAGVGTLIFEFEILSHLTGDPTFSRLSFAAVEKLWSRRSKLDLLGNSFDIFSLNWINQDSGIGAGMDSFYECLFKTYILFGRYEYLEMFMKSYKAVSKHLKYGPWYLEANMYTARPSHYQFNSLQAFWPGLQVLVGDLQLAKLSHQAFYGIWKKFKVFPERYLLQSEEIHPSERYYPLRPELMESTYLLYRATRDKYYLHVGKDLYESLINVTKVKHGFASVKNVKTRELEDRMTSFFLAETCKYLFLLFDEENFLHTHKHWWIFSTEGHIFPVWQQLPSTSLNVPDPSSLKCLLEGSQKKISFCHVPDKFPDHKCASNTDCGTSDNCIPRKCSPYYYCFTPQK